MALTLTNRITGRAAIATIVAVTTVLAVITGCGAGNGTVVDKGVRVSVVGKQRQPCYRIKVRNDSDGDTKTTCISVRRWKQVRVGQEYHG